MDVRSRVWRAVAAAAAGVLLLAACGDAVAIDDAAATEEEIVELQLSAKAIKTIDRIGIDAALARIRARGEDV